MTLLRGHAAPRGATDDGWNPGGRDGGGSLSAVPVVPVVGAAPDHLAASPCPFVLQAREGARSVGLKNACRSGPARHFCGAGVFDASGLGSRGASVGEVWPAPHPWWISSVSSSPSTGVGPPLTESPGRGTVLERGARGAPVGQSRPRGAIERVAQVMASSVLRASGPTAHRTLNLVRLGDARHEGRLKTQVMHNNFSPGRRLGDGGRSGSGPEAGSAGHVCGASSLTEEQAEGAYGNL